MFVMAAVITLLGFGLFTWVAVRIHTSNLEDEVVRGALRLSDTIKRSTRYSMLQNRKVDVYEIVSSVGAQPGIECIRIFNKEGMITFSTRVGEQGQNVDKDAEACTRCHDDAFERPISELPKEDFARVFFISNGHRVLGLTEPIYNEPGCSSAAGCHPPPEERKILGVVDVQTSLADVDAAVNAANTHFLLIAYGFMLVIATACGLFIWRFVHRPVNALIQGTRRLAMGELEHRISVGSRTEIGQLGESFNDMAHELAQARAELTDWTRTLEERVDAKTRTLKQAQQKLLQNEKMASLGSLSAVVAHEINNPLSGVLTYTKLSRKKLGSTPATRQIEEVQQYLEAMEGEIIRCGKIVRNLLAFSRQSTITASDTNINALIEKTTFLIGHKLELQEIRLTKDLAENGPTIYCDADRIQQALLAVLINAVEAMPDGGELQILSRAFTDDDAGGGWVEVRISDTGCGISDDVLPHLFEPFYTTKENKKGVGLGLSVVFGIVKRHRGRIEVDSKEGQGTRFSIFLPERSELEEELLPSGKEELNESTATGANV